MRIHTQRQHGFTLIELMISIALMAGLIMMAVPSFREAGLGSELRSSANDLAASARYARSEAIKQNVVVRLCVSSDGLTCGTGGWQQGWIVIKGATVLQHRSAAGTGMRIAESGGATSLNFQPTGLGATPATLTVCRASPTVGSQERVVSIDTTGRPRITRTANALCS